jgi:hypothetical protein
VKNVQINRFFVQSSEKNMKKGKALANYGMCAIINYIVVSE